MTGFSGSDPRAIEILRQSLSELYGVKGNVIDHYLIFWRRVLTGDFGPSLSAFPTPVMTIILRTMPWTFGLLMLSTIFAWIVGNMLGALAGYFRNNRFLKVIGMGVMALQPLPTYIVGLALVILLGYLWPILPISGGAQVNLPPALGWTYISQRAGARHLAGADAGAGRARRLVHLDALAGLQHRHRRPRGLCRARRRRAREPSSANTSPATPCCRRSPASRSTSATSSAARSSSNSSSPIPAWASC